MSNTAQYGCHTRLFIIKVFMEMQAKVGTLVRSPESHTYVSLEEKVANSVQVYQKRLRALNNTSGKCRINFEM